ncbi:hypothetical protein D3C76_591090 [compost metagenome]
MRRSVDAKSWFDRPATNNSPLFHFMSVTVKLRSGVSFQNSTLELFGFFSVTVVDFMLARSSLRTFWSAVTATIAGALFAPTLTAKYTSPEPGRAAMSSTLTLPAPSDLDNNVSKSTMLKVPSPFLSTGADNASACTWAPFQSATNRMFSGPNASRDTDFTSAAKVAVASTADATATSIFEYISKLL